MDEECLYIRFLCEDKDIVATMVNRDDPLYEEEVVEVLSHQRISISTKVQSESKKRGAIRSSHDGKHQGDPSWDYLTNSSGHS